MSGRSKNDRATRAKGGDGEMDSWDEALDRIDRIIWSIKPQLDECVAALREMQELTGELSSYYPPEYEEQAAADHVVDVLTTQVSHVGLEADRFSGAMRAACANVRAALR